MVKEKMVVRVTAALVKYLDFLNVMRHLVDVVHIN